MKIKGKKFLSTMLATVLIFTMIQPSVVSAMSKSKVDVKTSNNSGYEIYPNPHELNYLNGEFVIRKDVNVVYDSKIDEATKNRMTEVLQSKNKNIKESNKVVNRKTNILVGTYSSGEYADKYIQDKYEIDSSLFKKIDSYYMAAKNGEIVILGKNTDAAFYGITTLKHIFNQMDGSTIKNLQIEDYADTSIRGFIEGYYGLPWTNEDRMSLMKFGGEFKMTSYIFAPKDDPYHTSKWRELYPEDELAEIAKMVKVGKDTKTRFVWTAHPFMGKFNANDFEGEMEKLIAKFEQLYSIGVRQFGVLGDDVGNLDKKIVTDMMNRLSEWGKEKGDVYDWVFCPAGYNASWQGDYSELNTYDAAFPDNVQIFWTGQSVCAPVSQETLTNFKTNRVEEGKTRRSPLFWLNWPVNDINMQRLMMGKGSLLHTDINVEDLAGVVTNPMQDAEPSKVALFAIADYAWNVKGFDDDKSWEDSFKYIDSEAPEALHTIAKHTSDPAPNGHGLVLEESEDIKPLLEEFSNKLNGGENITESGTKIVNEMDIIIQACDEFIKTSKNKRMVEQITPFANSLKDLATSIKQFVQSAIDLEKNDNDSAVQNFAEGNTSYENSKKHDRVTIDGTKKAQPGSKRLIPFVQSVRDAISDEINSLVNGGEEKLKLTAETNISGIHQGKIENIIDGKNDTYIWNSAYEQVDQYYQVNLSRPTTIYGVDILNGNTSKKDDTFGHAKVQYTTDGQDWKDINNKIYGPYAEKVKITNVEIENVVGVRYICTQTDSGRKWPAMREFKILTTPQPEVPTFTSEVIRTTDGWSIHSGKESDMLDGDENTGVHYNVRQRVNPQNTTVAGDYVGVKLSEPIVLGKIKILQGPNASSGDYFKNATLEYSLNGVDYKEIKQCKNEKDITIDLSDKNIEAQYIRLRNNKDQETWIGFREFEVNAKIDHNGKVYTNVEKYKDHPADYFEDNASMVELSNITLEKDQYIGLMLDRIHELTEIVVNGNGLDKVTLQVSKNGYEWVNIDSKTLTENTNAKYVRLINLGKSAVTFDVSEFRLSSREFGKPKVIKNNMGPIYAGKLEDLFDKDRTTAVQFNRSQTKGDHMIIDLGQEIDLDKLKIVVHDSHKDYIRDGKIYASTDKENWGEAVVTIGNQEANATVDDSNINDCFPGHEISYNVAEGTNINKKARYLKLELTQSYAHRWTRINEIEINGGEYIPSINNPTFDSNVSDTENGLFEYLVDGDITTMYIPSADSGYLTYSLSKNNKVNHIKVMQNAKVISNANVSARVMSPTKGAQWVQLGTLNKGTNEFVLPEGTIILDIKFEWDGVVPNLVELVFKSAEDTSVDKEDLKKLIDENIDTSNWTINSAKAYETAIKVGKEIYDNEYSTQEAVNSAVKEIEKAKENHELRADVSDLESLINENLDSSKYTVTTWKKYQKALNAAKKAMEDVDNLSQKDVDKLVEELNKAKADLVYNPANREEAEFVIEDINEFIKNVQNPEKTYTKNSWDALLNAKTKLEELIELNRTKPQDPELFEQGIKSIEDLRKGLVEITSLVLEIEEFDAISDSSIYTEKSFKVYEDAITVGKELLVDGTAKEIEDIIVEITKAKNNLEFVASSENIKKFIDELKALNKDNYTTNSYTVLMNRVAEIENMNLDSMSEKELEGYQNELLGLKNSLVNIVELRNVVNMAKGLNCECYTLDSYNELIKLLDGTDDLFVSGKQEEVEKSVANIKNAINNLVIRVNKKVLVDYINNIEKIDLSKYTEESVSKYNKALEVLKSMLENVENTSAKDFINAKVDLEAAKESLELKPVKPAPDTDDGSNSGGSNNENGGNSGNNNGSNNGNGGNSSNNGESNNGNSGNSSNNSGSNNGNGGNNNINNGDSPKTGDSSILLPSGILLLALGALFVYRKKLKATK